VNQKILAMASWNEIFGTNNYDYNGQPDWMNMASNSVASQVIRYPVQHHGRHYECFTSTAPVDPCRTTMDLHVPICCEGCEERVKSRLIDIEGVDSVKCDQAKQKVTVSGTAPAAEVLRVCRKLFKRSNWWRI
jgi:copper chaperone CopZ